MKAILSMTAALGLAFVLPVSGGAGVNDPEVIIYRIPGVADDGGANFVGYATVFHCTNFSGATENVRFATRRSDGLLVGNLAFPVAHLTTLTTVTHAESAYAAFNLVTGQVNQGTTAIAATSINVICTAMTIDAALTKPVGVALRAIRFNPVPGSQE